MNSVLASTVVVRDYGPRHIGRRLRKAIAILGKKYANGTSAQTGINTRLRVNFQILSKSARPRRGSLSVVLTCHLAPTLHTEPQACVDSVDFLAPWRNRTPNGDQLTTKFTG